MSVTREIIQLAKEYEPGSQMPDKAFMDYRTNNFGIVLTTDGHFFFSMCIHDDVCRYFEEFIELVLGYSLLSTSGPPYLFEYEADDMALDSRFNDAYMESNENIL